MDNFIQQQLIYIEQSAKQIVSSIRGILGFCDGMTAAARNFNQESNGYQEIVSQLPAVQIKTTEELYERYRK